MNCAECSDPITDETNVVYEYTLWAEPNPALMPYRRPTGKVAHRTCIVPPRETESREVPGQLSLLDEQG